MGVIDCNVGLYSNIASEKIEWLWYPYIPFGKITLLQGDPGGGKSTMMMDIIGRVTASGELPSGDVLKPINVIYQCSEDGLADTIKPRLEKAGADCSRVGYITEDVFGLSLDDEKFRNAIIDMKAKLLIVDPFQAYIGDSDLSNANSMRKVLRRLSMWASAANCAVVLVGHLNKKSGTNELYRGLGSIDLVAAARSVLQVNVDAYNDSYRIVRHIKSSLAPKGNDLFFELDPYGKINWLHNDIYVSQNQEGEELLETIQTKQEKAAEIINNRLMSGSMEAAAVEADLRDAGIGERTYRTVKKIMSVESYKKDGIWYWSLPNHGEDDGEEI